MAQSCRDASRRCCSGPSVVKKKRLSALIKSVCVCVCVCVFLLVLGGPLQHPKSTSATAAAKETIRGWPCSPHNTLTHTHPAASGLPSEKSAQPHTHSHTHAHTHIEPHTSCSFIVYHPEWILIVLNRAFTTQMLFLGLGVHPHTFSPMAQTSCANTQTHTRTEDCTKKRCYIKTDIFDIPVKPSGIIRGRRQTITSHSVDHCQKQKRDLCPVLTEAVCGVSGSRSVTMPPVEKKNGWLNGNCVKYSSLRFVFCLTPWLLFFLSFHGVLPISLIFSGTLADKPLWACILPVGLLSLGLCLPACPSARLSESLPICVALCLFLSCSR